MAQLGYCPDRTTMTELASGLEVRVGGCRGGGGDGATGGGGGIGGSSRSGSGLRGYVGMWDERRGGGRRVQMGSEGVWRPWAG